MNDDKTSTKKSPKSFLKKNSFNDKESNKGGRQPKFTFGPQNVKSV